MGVEILRRLRGVLFVLLMLPGMSLACDAKENGCLGCTDAALPTCLRDFSEEICNTLGNPQNCDRDRVYDDAERYVLISTGRHMSRMLSLERSARKYRYR